MGDFLLASKSPRRSKLLADAGFDFNCVVPRFHERATNHLTLVELTAFNAIRKGLSVARYHPGHVVVAADTLVALRGEIIGKPATPEAAVAILKRLSGRGHEVCSSVFLCDLANNRSMSFREISRVYFRRLSDAAVRSYIGRVNPLDKAGGYGAQEESKEIIERIEGSYTNVIGLPMEKTVAALADFGIEPRAP